MTHDQKVAFYEKQYGTEQERQQSEKEGIQRTERQSKSGGGRLQEIQREAGAKQNQEVNIQPILQSGTAPLLPKLGDFDVVT